MHPVWLYVTRQESEHMTVEQLYDRITTSFTVKAVIEQLDRMEKLMSTGNTALARLETDAANLQTQLTNLQNSQATLAADLAAANARLEADILALQNLAGSGDTDAITAVATSLESTLSGMQAVQSQMDAISTGEVTVGVALTISPTTANVAFGGSQQFTANVSVNWSAAKGSISSAGMYTPPTDTTQTSDTVTATTPDGTQSATAVITLGAQAGATPSAVPAASTGAKSS